MWFASRATGRATVVRVIAGIVLTVYFILEGDEAYAWFLSLFPVERRLRLDQTLARASARMGRWLLGQGTLMLILGVSSTIVFALLQIRYAYALGVIMGLFNLVPVAGALISVSLVVLVAALDSWGRVAGVLIFYFAYLQVENTWLTPRIMRTQVDLAGLTILIALLIGVVAGRHYWGDGGGADRGADRGGAERVRGARRGRIIAEPHPGAGNYAA